MDQGASNEMKDAQSIPHEDRVSSAIEMQPAKISSVGLLALSIGAALVSLGLAAVTQKRKGWANFVGLLGPSILLLSIYNKVAKTQGSDTEGRASAELMH